MNSPSLSPTDGVARAPMPKDNTATESSSPHRRAWPRVMTILFAGLVFGGSFLSLCPLLAFPLGALAAFVWIKWEHTPPDIAIGRGALAGLILGSADLAVQIAAGLLIELASRAQSTTSQGLSLSVMAPLTALSALMAIGGGALAAPWISRHQEVPRLPRQMAAAPATTPAAQTAQPALPQPDLTPEISKLRYRALRLQDPLVTIVCPSCRAQIPIQSQALRQLAGPHAVTTAPGQLRPVITLTASTLKVPPAPAGRLLLSVMAFALLYMCRYVIGAWVIALAILYFLILMAIIERFSRHLPICLLSCSGCTAQIPLAIDASSLYVAERAGGPPAEPPPLPAAPQQGQAQ